MREPASSRKLPTFPPKSRIVWRDQSGKPSCWSKYLNWPLFCEMWAVNSDARGTPALAISMPRYLRLELHHVVACHPQVMETLERILPAPIGRDLPEAPYGADVIILVVTEKAGVRRDHFRNAARRAGDHRRAGHQRLDQSERAALIGSGRQDHALRRRQPLGLGGPADVADVLDPGVAAEAGDAFDGSVGSARARDHEANAGAFGYGERGTEALGYRAFRSRHEEKELLLGPGEQAVRRIDAVVDVALLAVGARQRTRHEDPVVPGARRFVGIRAVEVAGVDRRQPATLQELPDIVVVGGYGGRLIDVSVTDRIGNEPNPFRQRPVATTPQQIEHLVAELRQPARQQILHVPARS